MQVGSQWGAILEAMTGAEFTVIPPQGRNDKVCVVRHQGISRIALDC